MVYANVGKVCFAAAVVALLVLGSTKVNKPVTQILVKNGLPKGLIPASVKSYTLEDNGKFQVNLRSTCTIKVGGEKVYYKKTITGDLSYRQISNLSGIQVYESFFWTSVTSIEIDKISSQIIWFKIGYLSKALSAALFQVAPVCNAVSDELAEPNENMTFSERLSSALRGSLEANLSNIQDTGGVRRLLQ